MERYNTVSLDFKEQEFSTSIHLQKRPYLQDRHPSIFLHLNHLSNMRTEIYHSAVVVPEIWETLKTSACDAELQMEFKKWPFIDISSDLVTTLKQAIGRTHQKVFKELMEYFNVN